MVTAAKADSIIAEYKVIYETLIWRFERNAYRLRADVICEKSGEILSLRGILGKKNRSYVLLYCNVPIRKYTVHDRHKDPVSRIVHREPHKHYWDDTWGDARVYIPNDIRIGDHDEELFDFLRESNIFPIAHYSAPTSC